MSAWLKALRRLLIRLGLRKRKPLVCRHCGYVVPMVWDGHWATDRRAQDVEADLAFEHWEREHEKDWMDENEETTP